MSMSAVTTGKPAGKTAYVLAGGGSLGAVQVGMLKALAAHGLRPDFIVGAVPARSTEPMLRPART